MTPPAAPAERPSDDLPEGWQERDMWASWWLAHRIVGEDYKAGKPLPDCLRSAREDGR